MIATLALATLLSVSDPVGDTVGNGTLTPPTALVFRSPGAFDLQEIVVPDAGTFGFRLTMTQLHNPWDLANGFSLPIIEVYLSDNTTADRLAPGQQPPPGRRDLLPGSGMTLAEGTRWNYAFRLTGDDFTVYGVGDDGEVLELTDRLRARLRVEGNTLVVTTNLAVPERFSLYGTVGSYDPFSEHGWRAVTTEPGPWALSSPTQPIPVIDVMADSFDLQRRAIDSATLPQIRASFQQDQWLLVVFGGLAITVLGLFGRLVAYLRTYPDEQAAAESPSERSSASTS